MSEIGPGSTPGVNRSFGERVLGALKLDASVYEEVEHDLGSMGQAAAVVALGALAQGIGAYSETGAVGLAGGIVGGFLGWFASAFVIWLVGVKIMGHTSDYPELLRTTGFASVPQFLLVLGVLPLGPLRGLLAIGVSVLLLISFVVAVRQALDVGTGRAVWVCVLAVLAQVLLVVLLAVVLGGAIGALAPGAAPTTSVG